MDTVQNKLQSTADNVLSKFTIESQQINLPDGSEYYSITPKTINLNFSSVEKMLKSTAFNVTVNVGDIIKKMFEDKKDDGEGSSEEDELMKVIKDHIKKQTEGIKIEINFDLSGTNIDKLFSNDATPILRYFKVNGQSFGDAFEGKLTDFIEKYFGDTSFFDLLNLSGLINTLIGEKKDTVKDKIKNMGFDIS